MLAEENGLNGSETLNAGLELKLPNVVTNIHNNSDTFRPYDPGRAIGDVSPTLPDAPMAEIDDEGSCSTFGQIVGAIVSIIVTVILSPVLGPLGKALGDVLGDMVAQVIDLATGEQKGGYNWEQTEDAFMDAFDGMDDGIKALMTAGMSQQSMMIGYDVNEHEMVFNIMPGVRYNLSDGGLEFNPLGGSAYGDQMWYGGEKKFSWRDVSRQLTENMSAVGAVASFAGLKMPGASAALGVNDAMGAAVLDYVVQPVLQEGLSAYGNGRSFNWQSIAVQGVASYGAGQILSTSSMEGLAKNMELKGNIFKYGQMESYGEWMKTAFAAFDGQNQAGGLHQQGMTDMERQVNADVQLVMNAGRAPTNDTRFNDGENHGDIPGFDGASLVVPREPEIDGYPASWYGDNKGNSELEFNLDSMYAGIEETGRLQITQTEADTADWYNHHLSPEMATGLGYAYGGAQFITDTAIAAVKGAYSGAEGVYEIGEFLIKDIPSLAYGDRTAIEKMNTASDYVSGKADALGNYFMSGGARDDLYNLPGAIGDYLAKPLELAEQGRHFEAGQAVFGVTSTVGGAVTAVGALRNIEVNLSSLYTRGGSSTLSFGKIPERVTTSSGIPIEAIPNETTTILGSYKVDLKDIIEVQLNYPKTTNFGAKPSGFNVLNVDTNLKGDAFWDKYNQPFLDSAISRGDHIKLATTPTPKVLFQADGKTLTGFGREYQYLSSKGYYFDAKNHSMMKRDK